MRLIRLWEVFAVALVLSGVAAEKGNAATAAEPIAAILSCDCYGYKVKVVVNGVDLGLKGGGSAQKRLFNQSHPMSKEAPAEIARTMFVLKDAGANQIRVEFARQGAPGQEMKISLDLEEPIVPMFMLRTASKASGIVERSFTFVKSPPEDFKPVVAVDEGDERWAFVHLGGLGVNFTPVLNGKEEMQSMGIPGLISLRNVQPGKNELVLNYQSDPAVNKEFLLTVITPEWSKVLKRQVTDKKTKTETLTFTVK